MCVELFSLVDCFLNFNPVDIGVIVALHDLPLAATVSNDDDEDDQGSDSACDGRVRFPPFDCESSFLAKYIDT